MVKTRDRDHTIIITYSLSRAASRIENSSRTWTFASDPNRATISGAARGVSLFRVSSEAFRAFSPAPFFYPLPACCR